MFPEDIPPRRALTIPVGRSGLSMVETGPRREQRRLRPSRDVEAPDDLLDVCFDGAFRHSERIRDQFVGLALGDQRKDVALAARQFAPGAMPGPLGSWRRRRL